MRGQEFKARDKKVQKMTRDGLTEKNLTQGTEQRISSRLADASFRQKKQPDTAAGHRAQGRIQEQEKGQAHKPLYQQTETSPIQPDAADRFSDATAPEVWGPANAPASMREAADAPMFQEQSSSEAERAASDNSAPQKPAKKHQTAPARQGDTPESSRKPDTMEKTGSGRKTQEAVRRLYEADTPVPVKDTGSGSVQKERTPAPHGSGRLQFDKGEKAGEPEKDQAALKKKLAVKFSADTEKPADESLPGAGNIAEESTEPGRLRFGHEKRKETTPKYRTALKKKQARKFSANAAKSETTEERKKPLVPQENGRLRFDHEERKKAPARNRAKEKQKLAAKFSAEEKRPESPPRLQYDRSELPPEERKTTTPAKNGAPEPDNAQGMTRPQKKYETAQRRVETAGKKLEKAQSRLPTRRRVHLQKQYDSRSGKVKRRLQFETEVIPEYEKPSLPKQAGTALRRTATTAAALKLHQKIRETERDNVGVEAAHKAEFTAERVGGRILRWNKRRLHEKPYREVRRAEKRLAKANVDAAYQKLLMDNPQLQKKAFAKWIQKQKLKRKYAAAAREAAKGAEHTMNVLTATGQVIRAMVQKIVAHKAILGIIAIGVLIIVLSGSLFSSCSAMLTGVQSAVISTCYVAEDTEIERSELRYTELETDLQRNINSTETDNPGYDEYRYSIGEIGHNPYELMGYLSAAYGDFTYAQVEAELNRLFGQQYRLTRTQIVETRTYIDDEGEEQEYDWYVLQTTLTVRPLSGIIASSLAPGDQTDRYGVYMQTCGNRQCYANPFDLAWLSYVTSPYGYRTHPVTGAKDLHRGIDIGVAAGTPIKAAQDGRVVSAGNAGDYGLCVVIEGENGYQSKYAHCSSLSVRAGQEVRRGDVIAAVGSTGNSTGAHLHLEVTHNGQYLNPYYYVDNGGYGYLPGGGAAGMPDFPENPGAAMGDGSFTAMLTEAEKYLGFPYVWGGSSPATSFDCSGYVSWVINHSGVGSVGRQTAQGLYNLCTPVSRNDMQPGDLVFFTGTRSTAAPVTHVGIYVGGNRMIHCGNPISYANLDTSYWLSKFYSGGRLP
ncbi:CD1108 family mobile element protein [Otoolea muris]|uniref:CD1108 family mobile element protein n=1 Tax=Otoolea muris TaxID=2941515 RepID=UPI00203B3FE3|nr:peptidoglycan DD-metalloendopeptidase family protein [Otoolea muris]